MMHFSSPYSLDFAFGEITGKLLREQIISNLAYANHSVSVVIS